MRASATSGSSAVSDDGAREWSAALPELGAVVEMVVETPRWSAVKRRPDGRVEFIALPCPYNYGCVPGTIALDGDPLDVVLLGSRRPRGARVSARVLGVVDFVDAGLGDPKLIAVALEPAEAADEARGFDGIERFFRAYALFKRARARARGRGDAGPDDTRFRGWLRHPVSAASAARPVTGASPRSRS